MGIIMITHDLGVVRNPHDVCVYCRKIVERSDVKSFLIIQNILIQGLIESIQSFDSTTGASRDRLPTIEGMVQVYLNYLMVIAFRSLPV